MKKITIKCLAVAAIALTTATAALAQGSFAYQAVIRTADGKLVSNQKVGMKFSIMLNDSVCYSEVQTPTTNEFGNVSVMIGSGTKESGDFMKAPWSTMNLMLQVEVDAKGGSSYVNMGKTQILAVPYSMYAQTASKIEASQKSASANEPIFEVKDKDGNLVFAVFPDGVKVYVDDTDAAKAKRSGFVVTGRSATKEGENPDYFAVNAEGTQVYVDDDADKAVRSGFVVKGRTATKDDETADYLAVNGAGTQVYVDDDADKAVRSGFVVKGRTATKEGNADVFKIDGDGTQVFINDTASDKAVRSGFVVKGRTATKDGQQADYLAVNGEGTQVYVDADAAEKAVRSGFVVKGRTATKDDDVDVFVVDGEGTQVFIDDTDADKAKRSGFVVTGRSATKDGEGNQYLSVTSESIDFSSSSFNVADKNSSEKVLAVTNGNVQVNSDLLMTGEVGKVVEAEVVGDKAFEIILKDVVATATPTEIDNKEELVDGDGRYALLRITDNSYVPVYEWDSLMYDERGYVTTNKKNAVVSVSMPPYSEDSEIIVRKLVDNLSSSFTAEFGLTFTTWNDMQQDTYMFKKVKIVVENPTTLPDGGDEKPTEDKPQE